MGSSGRSSALGTDGVAFGDRRVGAAPPRFVVGAGFVSFIRLFGGLPLAA
jgi:hypothetical protein